MTRLHLSNGWTVAYTGDHDEELERMVRDGAQLSCCTISTFKSDQRDLVVNGAQVVAIQRPSNA